MLVLYFSATGNTKVVAELFSAKMSAKCHSIEEDIDFSTEIQEHDTIVFCYPIYCSRVPRIMREFAHNHKEYINGKKMIILVTQQIFSGDGARVFTDLFEKGAIEVIYAEHFNMQQNMGNIPVYSMLFKPTAKSESKFLKKTEKKINTVCDNIRKGVVKKRGFSKASIYLGYIQGKQWQKNAGDIKPVRLEKMLMNDVQIHKECTVCNVCTKICPMNNLINIMGKIKTLNNCTVCYRCVNICPQKSITVYLHSKPKWQYNLSGVCQGDGSIDSSLTL